MSSAQPVIMVTAADVSGDAHAAGLIAALSARLGGQVTFVGVGGPRMARAGCRLLAEPVGRAAMLAEALKHVAYYRRLIRRVADAFDEYRPAVHVPVDSPMMNWHLAAAAKKRGVPVAYYIAPQVWAWGGWRVAKLRRLTDVVACILPFEPDLLRPRGVNARFVGHPLLDALPPPDPPDLASAAAGGTWRITLLPGSRAAEIRGHAPALAAVMDSLGARFPRAQFTFAAVDAPAAELIRQSAGRADLPVAVGQSADLLRQSHFAIAASGTVTLEAAHFGVPMVVFYRTGRLAWHLLGRWVIRTPRLSLVNILAGRELVPELMPWHGDPGRLLRAAQTMLADPDALARTRRALLDLAAPLKAPPPSTAADNAAKHVLDVMR